MTNKYKFTGKTKEVYGKTLKQIVCVTAFSLASVGDVGGWIESDENLSQSGNAWVSGNARVFGNAEVSGNAWVFGDARVFGDAEVSGNARVFGDARVSGNGEKCTSKAITISTNYHHVTITDTHITIGCQNKTKEFWSKADFKIIEKIDGEKSAMIFMEYKPFIMKLAGIEETNKTKG